LRFSVFDFRLLGFGVDLLLLRHGRLLLHGTRRFLLGRPPAGRAKGSYCLSLASLSLSLFPSSTIISRVRGQAPAAAAAAWAPAAARDAPPPAEPAGTSVHKVQGSVFRVSGFGFRVSSFGFRVSCFVFRVSGLGLPSSLSARHLRPGLRIHGEEGPMEQQARMPPKNETRNPEPEIRKPPSHAAAWNAPPLPREAARTFVHKVEGSVFRVSGFGLPSSLSARHLRPGFRVHGEEGPTRQQPPSHAAAWNAPPPPGEAAGTSVHENCSVRERERGS
jgi:hypothetical protein